MELKQKMRDLFGYLTLGVITTLPAAVGFIWRKSVSTHIVGSLLFFAVCMIVQGWVIFQLVDNP